MNDVAPLLSVRDLSVEFRVPKSGLLSFGHQSLKAVNQVSFDLYPGETLGIVGESGCGKSTLARAILQLIPHSGGEIVWCGENVDAWDAETLRSKRQDLQIIFQDPLASLNPRMTIGEIIAEPLQTHQPDLDKQRVQQAVQDIMAQVGLLPEMINRYPHEFSGGQCQRIGIARAMILKPKLLICDEAVSALDVSIQAQIVNLLMQLQAKHQMSLLFISHNLSVVKHISHRILVLYLGRMVEMAGRDSIYQAPHHPYTQALISAVPIPDPVLEANRVVKTLEGDLPSPLSPPKGCVFNTRCELCIEQCKQQAPQAEVVAQHHQVACHRWETAIAGAT